MMPWTRQPPAAIDWSQFITRVSLAGLTPTVELRYYDSPWGPLVGVSRWVRDVRDTACCYPSCVSDKLCSKPCPTEVKPIRAAYPLPAVTTVDDAMGCLYRLVSGNLGHEVLEHMKLDNKTWRNPHG